MKPEYANNLTKIQFFKFADYYGMSKIYEDLYIKSSKNINVKNLMPIIKNKQNMLIAIRYIKANITSIADIDSKSFTELLQNNSVEELHCKVCNLIDNYESDKTTEKHISKRNKKLIFTNNFNVMSKLIAQMIKQVIEPFCEAKFYKHSYGFRPTRQVDEFIARCHHLVSNARCEYCVDIKIKDFFDNIHHNKLIKQIWNLGIRDKSVLILIKKIIGTSIDGNILKRGISQNGILSPLIVNIALNDLDQWVSGQWEDFQNHCNNTKNHNEFYKELQYKNKTLNPNYNPKNKTAGNVKYFRKWKTLKTGFLVRYADDFKIFAPNYNESIKWFNGIKQFIEKRLLLKIDENESKIVNLKKSKVHFFDFELKIVNTYKKYKKRRPNVKNKSSKTKYVLRVRMNPEKIRKISDEFKSFLKQMVKTPYASPKIINKLNVKILEWQNYCSLSTYPSKDLQQVYIRNYTKLKVLERYYGILKHISMNEAKDLNNLLNVQYKEYNGFTFSSNYGGIIFPIWAVKQKKVMQRNPNINPFIRKDLKTYWDKFSKWEDLKGKKLIESYCNCAWVSSLIAIQTTGLYIMQCGKCPITELPLNEGFEIHHKKAKSNGGNDNYTNLVILNKYAHKLVHTSNEETSRKYVNLIKNFGGKINVTYLNELRKLLNLKPIIILP